jgi:hypothetical protein
MLCFFPKTYTLAGFEPGSAVSEADAMSTAPRRQGMYKISCKKSALTIETRRAIVFICFHLLCMYIQALVFVVHASQRLPYNL